MLTRPLGTSDLAITPLGFGAWALGGESEFGWGPQDDADSVRAIHRALDLGINWIDTAPVYGLGHSEEIVAKALEGRSMRPYIFTKCSFVWNEKNELSRSLKADSIRREVEQSLRRLRVETIDLYQIHWPNPEGEIEEGWATLAALQKEGKLRHIGVSNFSPAQMDRCRAIAPITSQQPKYSAVARAIEADVLPYCLEHRIGVIAYSPMGSGLLTGAMTPERVASFAPGDWRRRSSDFREPRLSRNLAIAALMKQIGEKYGKTAAVVALAWTLRQPAVTGAIVGARNAAQVDGFIDAGTFRLPAADIAEIEAFLARPS
jgi:aryl-alcohol dehydrogenase-like predicted oxidoreductase